jgi:hypothetical protein
MHHLPPLFGSPPAHNDGHLPAGCAYRSICLLAPLPRASWGATITSLIACAMELGQELAAVFAKRLGKSKEDERSIFHHHRRACSPKSGNRNGDESSGTALVGRTKDGAAKQQAQGSSAEAGPSIASATTTSSSASTTRSATSRITTPGAAGAVPKSAVRFAHDQHHGLPVPPHTAAGSSSSTSRSTHSGGSRDVLSEDRLRPPLTGPFLSTPGDRKSINIPRTSVPLSGEAFSGDADAGHHRRAQTAAAPKTIIAPRRVGTGKKCQECDEDIAPGAGKFSGSYYTVGAGDQVHTECWSNYKVRTARSCEHCGLAVTPGPGISGRFYSARDGKPVHEECWAEHSARSAPACGHCGEPIAPVGRFSGRFTQLVDSQVHSECLPEHRRLTAPCCDHCKLGIIPDATLGFSGGYSIVDGGRKVHAECMPAWRGFQMGKCCHCQELIRPMAGRFSGAWYDNPSGDGKLHVECLSAHERESAPPCAQCGKKIGTGGQMVQTDTGATLHSECLDAYHVATAPKCLHCHKAVAKTAVFSGQFYQTDEGEGSDKKGGRVHAECWEQWLFLKLEKEHS